MAVSATFLFKTYIPSPRESLGFVGAPGDFGSVNPGITRFNTVVTARVGAALTTFTHSH